MKQQIDDRTTGFAWRLEGIIALSFGLGRTRGRLIEVEGVLARKQITMNVAESSDACKKNLGLALL